MKGVYLVFVRLQEPKKIEVGALGEIKFEEGVYCYVGSAMTSLEKRIGRHYSNTENKHWHIDYFTSEAEVFDHLVVPENSSYECVLAEIVSGLGKPVFGFGASDCSCETHLFRLAEGFSASKRIE